MEEKITKIKITRANIDEFIPIDGQRKVNNNHVNKLMKAIRDGTFITSDPLYLNDTLAGHRVIEGNHRLVAIKKLLTLKVIPEIEMTCVVYQGLSPEKEKSIYDRLAKKKTQSVNDLLWTHKNESLLWELLQDKPFPIKVSIYGNQASVKYKNILNLVDISKTKNLVGLSRDKILGVSNISTIKDFNKLAEFFSLFVSSFGEVVHSNKYANPLFLQCLFAIWDCNWKDGLKAKELADERRFWMKALSQLVGLPEVIEIFAKANSRDNRVQVFRDLIFIFNRRGGNHNKRMIKGEPIISV